MIVRCNFSNLLTFLCDWGHALLLSADCTPFIDFLQYIYHYILLRWCSYQIGGSWPDLYTYIYYIDL